MLEKQKAREPYRGDLHIIGNSFLKDLLKCVCIGIGVFYTKCGSNKFYSLKKFHYTVEMKLINI